MLNTHRFERQYEKENVNYLIKMVYIGYIGHMLKRNDILPTLGKRKYITKINSLFQLFNEAAYILKLRIMACIIL